jgi:hypothetical protein
MDLVYPVYSVCSVMKQVFNSMKKAKKAEPKELCLNFVIEPSGQTNGADHMNCRIYPGDGQEDLPFTSGPLFAGVQSNHSSYRPGFPRGCLCKSLKGKVWVDSQNLCGRFTRFCFVACHHVRRSQKQMTLKCFGPV